MVNANKILGTENPCDQQKTLFFRRVKPQQPSLLLFSKPKISIVAHLMQVRSQLHCSALQLFLGKRILPFSFFYILPSVSHHFHFNSLIMCMCLCVYVCMCEFVSVYMTMYIFAFV